MKDFEETCQELKFVIERCSGPEVIKLCSQSTRLSTNFFLLINVKMPTIVGILTLISKKTSILGLSELDKTEFLYIYKSMSISNFILG